jgi:hypothetical protein
MLYESPNGTEYKLTTNSQTGLLSFTPVAGGAVPNLLSGVFTKQNFIQEAWNKYVKSCDKKPDLRLKENKK